MSKDGHITDDFFRAMGASEKTLQEAQGAAINQRLDVANSERIDELEKKVDALEWSNMLEKRVEALEQRITELSVNINNKIIDLMRN